jgi:uncharacterized protein (DUF58 family)
MGLMRQLLARSKTYTLFFGARRVEDSPIFLAQRRVYVLPTLHGVTFGMALILMLIGSVNYALSLGFLLTFLLAGMSLVGMVHTYRNLLHLYVSPGRCEPVFAGARAQFVVLLDNRNRYGRHTIIGRVGPARAPRAMATADIAPSEIAPLTLSVPSTKRGWMTLGRVTLETRYPLGLFRSWSYVNPEVRVLVYPHAELTDLPPEHAVPEYGAAVAIGTGTDDFAGMRPYQPSDSPRHIAWKVAARTEQLVVKQWTGQGSAELWLDWTHLPPTMDDESRLSRLTGWVLGAAAGERMYGLRLPGHEIGLARGPQHRDRCLRALALFGIEDEPPGSAI